MHQISLFEIFLKVQQSSIALMKTREMFPCIGQFREGAGVAAHPFCVLGSCQCYVCKLYRRGEDAVGFEVVASTGKGKACCFYKLL